MSKRKTTKTGDTVVTFLIDRSGSMQVGKDDTIGAFNAYLGGLRNGGEPITFSFVQFDTMGVDTLCKNVPIGEVAELTDATYQPRGGTPLIDAAYKTIKAVEAALAKRDDSPKIVICIQTDGRENASVEHSWDDLNALIKEKTALGWQFNFMGAGIDAYQQGARMGIATANTVSYDRYDKEATRAAFSSAAAGTMRYASGQAMNTSFLQSEKAASRDAFDPNRHAAQRLSGQAPLKVQKKPIVDDISL